MFTSHNIRADFPIFDADPSLAYLDNASTSQMPRQVLSVLEEYYKSYKSNVHRGSYPIAVRATERYEQSRVRVASFIGAEPDEIIFTGGTTDSLNMLAYSLGKDLKPGDEIVVTEMEHHSNFVPWQQIAKQKGLAFRVIPVDPHVGLSLEMARTIITSRTKIVAAVHISHVLGAINDAAELANIAHERGAIFVLDAAQSVPHMPVNVKNLDCDFMVFSGHKTLGPTGIGVLYGKRAALDNLAPVFFGGGMIREVSIESSDWTDVPQRFEAGTPPIAQAIALDRAIEYLQVIGIEQVATAERELAHYARTRLMEITGCTIYGNPEPQSSIISFNVDGVHSHDLADILARRNIAVRAGHHCAMPLMQRLGVAGTLRISLYIYNTREDLDKLIEGIIEAKRVFRHGRDL